MKFHYLNNYLENINRILEKNVFEYDEFLLHLKDVNPVQLELSSIKNELDIYSFDVRGELNEINEMIFIEKILLSFCKRFGTNLASNIIIYPDKITLLGINQLFNKNSDPDEQLTWEQVSEKAKIKSYSKPLKSDDLKDLLQCQLNIALEANQAINNLVANKKADEFRLSKIAILKLAIDDIFNWLDLLKPKKVKEHESNLNEIKKITLKSLFDDSLETYDKFIHKLEQEEIILIEGDKLKLIMDDTNLEKIRSICCIGYLLKQKGYLKSKINNKNITQKILTVALQNTFDLNISESAYSAAKKDFISAQDNANDASYDYLDRFHFI